MNDTGSRIDNDCLEFNGSVAGGSNIRSMTNDAHPSDNHTLATSVNPLSSIQYQSQMESSWSSHIPTTFMSWPPPMISQASPLSYRAGSALKICAACDARLMTLRNHIRVCSHSLPLCRTKLAASHYSPSSSSPQISS